MNDFSPALALHTHTLTMYRIINSDAAVCMQLAERINKIKANTPNAHTHTNREFASQFADARHAG